MMHCTTAPQIVRWFCLIHSLTMCPVNSRMYRVGTKLIERFAVPLEKKSWSVAWTEYQPTSVIVDFGSKPWADADLKNSDFKPKWNKLDGKVDRRSFCGSGVYEISAEGYPLNPTGRTGIAMRGVLGRWGPNHAADPIVTRWKRDSENQIVLHSTSKKPILQFVSIQRSDVKEWAIPGGMVDPGEMVSATLKREFLEESVNFLEMSAEKQQVIKSQLQSFFNISNGYIVYRGYVEDPRNTDNAWIETTAVNFHDESGEILNEIALQAGDDAQNVRWIDMDRHIKLYANHSLFIEKAVQQRNGHW